MIPSVIIYYVRAKTENRPGEKIAKAAFVNESDALIFWLALDDKRKRYLIMETIDGEPVIEIAHTGRNDRYGYYSHAYAITKSNPLPPRKSDRVKAMGSGWEFVEIEKNG